MSRDDQKPPAQLTPWPEGALRAYLTKVGFPKARQEKIVEDVARRDGFLDLGDYMTPRDLKDARRALGLSVEELRGLLNVRDARNIRRWENGDQDIPGPVVVILSALTGSAEVRAHFGITKFDLHAWLGDDPPRGRGPPETGDDDG